MARERVERKRRESRQNGNSSYNSDTSRDRQSGGLRFVCCRGSSSRIVDPSKCSNNGNCRNRILHIGKIHKIADDTAASDINTEHNWASLQTGVKDI